MMDAEDLHLADVGSRIDCHDHRRSGFINVGHCQYTRRVDLTEHLRMRLVCTPGSTLERPLMQTFLCLPVNAADTTEPM